MIEHPVKFQETDQPEQADQEPKQDLVPREHDQQRDRPKRDGADEPQNKSGTRRYGIRPGLLKSCGHAPASSQCNKFCPQITRPIAN